MSEGRKPQKEIDDLINEALRTEPDYFLSSSFTDKLVIKVRRNLIWKELVTEFALKIGLIIIALIILTVCLIFPSTKEGNPVILYIMNNLHFAGIIGFLVLFTFFIDQVILKYFFRKKVLTERSSGFNGS